MSKNVPEKMRKLFTTPVRLQPIIQPAEDREKAIILIPTRTVGGQLIRPTRADLIGTGVDLDDVCGFHITNPRLVIKVSR